MAKAGGVDYADAARDAVTLLFAGVPMWVASPGTLLRTKQTVTSPLGLSLRRPASRFGYCDGATPS